MMKLETNAACAAALDRMDPLSGFREEFFLPPHQGGNATYFLGNSLGLQPKSVRKNIDDVLGQWADHGVESFFMADPPWMDLHDTLRLKLSPIAGALPQEISIMNQLTVNIHLMLVGFYRPSGKKRKILIEGKAFPSDQYALRSYLSHIGQDPDDVLMELKGAEGTEVLAEDLLFQAIDQHAEEIALVFMGGVNYYSGQLFDMASITRKAHEHGILVGFDLAHAVGNVSLRLHDWDVDFACWCSYKYLNGGPGAVAAVYVHERFHHDAEIKRLAGWWGYKKKERFLMTSHFLPEADASGWQVSTPPILQYACLKSSLDIFEKAGWDKVLEKQTLMISWLDRLLNDLSHLHFKRLTPQERGCQVSLYFPEKGRRVYDLLTASGFMVDWREPGVIRLAPVPLYNTYTELWNFYIHFREVLKQVFLTDHIQNQTHE